MKTTKIDFNGQTIGDLLVLRELPDRHKGNVVWLCRCSCGKELSLLGCRLNQKTHCGCKQKSIIKHGQSNSRLYRVWAAMVTRCTNKKFTHYKYYGGKGITVCAEWKTFKGFYDSFGYTYVPGLTLDRKDSLLGYSPDNCRWVNMTVQNLNRSNNVLIPTVWGNLPIKEAADKAGLSFRTVKSRRQLGWHPLQLLIPVGQKNESDLL